MPIGSTDHISSQPQPPAPPPGFISLKSEDHGDISYIRSRDIIAVHPRTTGTLLVLVSHKQIGTPSSVDTVLRAIENAEKTEQGYLA